jgi:acetylglutamate kinase
VEIVEMVLSGSINKQIVSYINSAGGKAIGLSGKDADLIRAKRLTRTKRDPDSNIEKVLDLGFVGEPAHVNADLLATLARSDFIPVIAPIGVGEKDETYNINADTVAGAVAGALRAKRLLLLTDVAGVMDKNRKFIPELSVKRTKELIADGAISGGMIPKVETCLAAVAQGVDGAVIMDGRVPNAVLLELFTQPGFGTRISRRGAK